MATEQAPQQQQQRYELVSTLGKGGMAEVFLGWMHSVGGLRRKVAIKRILPDLAQKQSRLFEQMFVDEARLAFQLEHDNIVRVYDVGQSAETFFIVMEYVQGYDLKKIYEKLVERNQMMPLGVSLYITAQVAAGLAYAHELTDDEGNLLGLVHNDISPPNILIGRHGEVKIADFGLSDARSNAVVTPEGMVKGKFAYISPESTRDPSLVTARSDIFSVGIVLWEIIAGRRLFQKDTDLDTFQAVRACDVPDIRAVRPDVPEALVRILGKALAADPADRYDSARALFRDITAFSRDHQVALDRYQLIQLVNDLAGHEWQAFVGEKVTDAEQADLQGALEGMLPPGVAKHLKSFVTGGSVVDDVEDAVGVQDDWVGDVFGEVGFEDGEMEDYDVPPEMAEQIAAAQGDSSPSLSSSNPSLSPTSNPSLSPTSNPSLSPTSNPSLSPASDPSLSPTSGPSFSPATPVSENSRDIARQAAPSPNSDSGAAANEESMRQAVAQMEAQFKSRKAMFLVWGGVGGMVIGTLLGVVIGALI